MDGGVFRWCEKDNVFPVFLVVTPMMIMEPLNPNTLSNTVRGLLFRITTPISRHDSFFLGGRGRVFPPVTQPVIFFPAAPFLCLNPCRIILELIRALLGVSLRAVLALSKITVSHLGMSIKIRRGPIRSALEAGFHIRMGVCLLVASSVRAPESHP